MFLQRKLYISLMAVLLMVLSVKSHAAFRDCNDKQVYLAVMESARNDLPNEFKQWTLRGSQGIETLEEGRCKIKLLFVTGRSDGRMTEVWATFETNVPLSKIEVSLVEDYSPRCKEVERLKGEFVTLVSGTIPPEKSDCYILKTTPSENIKLEVRSWRKNTVATILDVGDARSEFEFLAETDKYEIHIFQLFRSPTEDRYSMIIEVR